MKKKHTIMISLQTTIGTRLDTQVTDENWYAEPGDGLRHG